MAGHLVWLRPVTISQAHQHTKMAAACYFLLGSGILAPWNALITAADYYETIYPVGVPYALDLMTLTGLSVTAVVTCTDSLANHKSVRLAPCMWEYVGKRENMRQ
jgi:hypothetical protein